MEFSLHSPRSHFPHSFKIFRNFPLILPFFASAKWTNALQQMIPGISNALILEVFPKASVALCSCTREIKNNKTQIFQEKLISTDFHHCLMLLSMKDLPRFSENIFKDILSSRDIFHSLSSILTFPYLINELLFDSRFSK